MTTEKAEEISVLFGDIKTAEEVLLLKFGITIENRRQKDDRIIGELKGLSGFIRQAKKAGYISEGNFVRNPVKKAGIPKTFFCI